MTLEHGEISPIDHQPRFIDMTYEEAVAASDEARYGRLRVVANMLDQAFQGVTNDLDHVYLESKAAETLNGYRQLQLVLRTFSHEQKIKMYTSFLNFAKNNQELLILLNFLFMNHASDDLESDLCFSYGFELERVAEQLNNEFVLTLLDFLLDDPKTHRFQIGIILTAVKLNNLPSNIMQKLQPQLTDLEIELRPSNNAWYLCGSSETHFERSLADSALLMVNEHLAVKFRGKITGLCVETFTTSNGQTFLKGHWYSPVDEKCRTDLIEAFDNGVTRITLPTSVWAAMRPLKKRDDEERRLFFQLQKFVAELPAILPQQTGDLDSRKSYREVHGSEF